MKLSASQETSPPTPFPIVGIGASAGGLGAFEAFFSGMPAEVDPGMAFVLVQHLAPDHESILTELIRRYTRMEVYEVQDGMVVRPNCAYIIPPGRDMAFLNGTLQLLEPIQPRGHRLPIDFFFQSLAQDQRERAIGIVLSGTGSDGAIGVRAIKREGGMVMAQNPESTEFDGMPRSALATGLVDFELPPAEMARQLIAYVAHASSKPFERPVGIPAPKFENALRKIFVLLRAQTGHNFSQYKPSTIHRRIERRMAVHQIDSIDCYVKFLQQMPAEVEALFRDLLIGVTNFFRDTEAFQVLEAKTISKLFVGKPTGSVIRVWCPGCSTGEEAYSIAILLRERVEALKENHTLQVFATDIDSQAIATARAGLYPASIAADISPERLARFFTADPGGGAYRIHRGIRDTVVFSEQNVIKDPPFSKLDLISCRNLMIYFGGDLQKKLIPLFHYALNPGGMLFLGTSETVGDFGELFAVVDRKSKLYQRKEDFRGAQRISLGLFPTTKAAIQAMCPQADARTAFPVKLPLRELTEQALLQKATPAGALVNGQGEILYLHGKSGMYLELSSGEVGLPNILKMAREGLRHALSSALHRARGTQEPVRCPGLRVKTNGHFTRINLSIHPVATGMVTPHIATLDASLYLVVLEEALPSESAGLDQPSQGSDPAADIDGRIAALKQELQVKEEYLQTACEEMDTSNEELKSSNEEMQSVNEEMQSTNEELETSKEELQSVNEELATVNCELQTKVADVSRANNDMNNLLAGTGIGTVFVDLHLNILRFTPTASAIINLILSDVGRPIAHQVSNLLGYDRLVADLKEVLDTLIPKLVEVQTQQGEWYTMRILPYRTLDGLVEGAVITFVDITEMKRAHKALHESQALLKTAMDNSQVGIAIADAPDGTLRYVNDAGLNIRGEEQRNLVNGIGQYVSSWHLHDLDGKPVAPDEEPLTRAIKFGEPSSREFIIQRPLHDDRVVQAKAAPILNDSGQVSAAVMVFMDITESRQQAELLRKRDEQFRNLVWNMNVGVLLHDSQATILMSNPKALEFLGLSEDQLLGRTAYDPDWNAIHEDGSPYPGTSHPVPQAIATRRPVRNAVMGVHRPNRGDRVWLSVDAIPQWHEDGTVDLVICTFTEITARIQAEEALRKANKLLRLAVVVRDAHDAITVQDLEGRTLAWNPGAVRMYGWSEVEALAMNVRDRIPKGLWKGALATLARLSRAEILEPYLAQRIAKDRSVVEVSIISTALMDEAGQMYAIATTERARESKKV